METRTNGATPPKAGWTLAQGILAIALISWLVGMLVVPFLFWEMRGQIPAAGLAVTDARVTQTIDGLVPGPPVARVRLEDLAQGIIAFAAIRAPAGLSQQVVFEWRHNGDRERIEVEIQGGRADGFRAYSRKHVFPADPTGLWTVDVLTPQAQLLERLRFVVERLDSLAAARDQGEPLDVHARNGRERGEPRTQQAVHRNFAAAAEIDESDDAEISPESDPAARRQKFLRLLAPWSGCLEDLNAIRDAANELLGRLTG